MKTDRKTSAGEPICTLCKRVISSGRKFCLYCGITGTPVEATEKESSQTATPLKIHKQMFPKT